MWPFHTWLPDAHVEAPTAGSVILAGVLLKLGGYGFIRFALPLFPDAAQTFAPLIIVLSLIAIIYGAIVSIVQPDLKKLVAYSSVSHMGFVTLGIFVFQQQAMDGRRAPDGQPRPHHRRPLPVRRRHLRADPRPDHRAHGRPGGPDAGLRRHLRLLHARQRRAARSGRLRRRVPGLRGHLRGQPAGRRHRRPGHGPGRRLPALDVPARGLRADVRVPHGASATTSPT